MVVIVLGVYGLNIFRNLFRSQGKILCSTYRNKKMLFEISNVISNPINVQFKYFDPINFSENLGHDPKTSTANYCHGNRFLKCV